MLRKYMTRSPMGTVFEEERGLGSRNKKYTEKNHWYYKTSEVYLNRLYRVYITSKNGLGDFNSIGGSTITKNFIYRILGIYKRFGSQKLYLSTYRKSNILCDIK